MRRAKIIEIIVKEDDPIEKAIRRYKKKYDQLKIMQEIRKRMYHMTKAEKRREEIKRAIHRQKKMLEAMKKKK